jgi:hypothetical protein
LREFSERKRKTFMVEEEERGKVLRDKHGTKKI